MKRLHLHYEKHFALYDPLLCLIVVVALACFLDVSLGSVRMAHILDGDRQSLYETVATISGSLLGFIIATVSIIVGFSQVNGLRVMRESEQLGPLFEIYFSAIRYLALTTVWSLVSSLLDRDADPRPLIAYACLWAVLISIRYVQLCVWILHKIIRIVVRQSLAPSAKR